MFDGENPDGWITKAERFVHFYGLTKEEMMEASMVSLDGDVLL